MSERHNRPGVMKWLQEEIGSSKLWPWEIKRVIYGKKHLNNPERFKVLVFLYVNGLAKWKIKLFFTQLYVFDYQGWRHINYLLDHVQEKVINKQWHAWDIHAKQSSHLLRKGVHTE